VYTVINVIKALSGLIETNFPEYPVNDRDIEEGFDRPSYFIDIEETVAENVTQYLIRERCQLKLYFFAENNYHGFLALLQMRSQLLDLLRRPLPVTNDDEDVVGHILFTDVAAEVYKADKTLECTINSEWVQQRPDEETSGWNPEMIQNLNMDLNKLNEEDN